MPSYIQQSEKERNDFVKMLDIINKECRMRCNIWGNGKHRNIFEKPKTSSFYENTEGVTDILNHFDVSIPTQASMSWYDPFGSFYETVASSFTKSNKGQFFTPEPLCNMMALITIPPPKQGSKEEKVLEPACGSGRMVLAANAINPMNYHISNDLDALCTKMTAVNYCLNGVVGEITCNDGLWNTKENYRFGYKCVPLAATNLGEQSLFKMWAFMSEAIRNQYILIPIDYEQAMYSVNEESTRSLVEIETQRRKEVAPKGLEGLLFNVETLDKKQKTKPSERLNQLSKKTENPITNTLELF